MIVRIERGIKDGKQFMNVIVDGAAGYKHELSRVLTGTTNEYGEGVFQDIHDHHEMMFQYGEQQNMFSWPVFVFHDHTIAECASEVMRRVYEVTDWQKRQDYTESIEFDCSERGFGSRR